MLTDGLFIGFAVFACAAFSLCAWSAGRRYRQLPALPELSDETETRTNWPTVDIFVPARDEALNIERVVTSLVSQDYPAFTVTVIDDQSHDNTATLAQAAGATVLPISSDPPSGWTGKCNACEQGALLRHFEWLLFTDADTYHQPHSLRSAIAYAEAHQLDALSLLLRQECIGFWERIVLPLAYQQFFAVLQPDRAAFNGQYILIRRAAYAQSGGFGAVRGRVMEDVALAEVLAAQGYRIALLNGHAAASVRMYRDGGALWRGMTKTAFAAARDRGAFGWLLGGLTFIGLFTVLMFGYGIVTRDPVAVCAALVILLWNAAGLLTWLKRFGVAPPYVLFNLLGMCLLWLAGMVSTLRVVSGAGVVWKGRVIQEKR